MKNLVKIVGFSFLGLLIFGMFFTIINNDKKTPGNIDNFSGAVLGASGDSLSGTLDTLLASDDEDIAEIETALEDLINVDDEDSKEVNKANELEIKEEKVANNTKSKEEIILIKDIKKEVAGLYVPNSMKLPGTNLETKVGKVYEVGVHALKINDKTFTIKDGYLSEGDMISQLDKANSRGCFRMEVLSSKNPDNVGKIGYVCKKYLREYEHNVVDSKIEKEDEGSYNITTKVGDTYSVNTHTEKVLETDRTISFIEVGTIVEQVENEDKYGCFVALVLKSYGINRDVGKIGYICKLDLENAPYITE